MPGPYFFERAFGGCSEGFIRKLSTAYFLPAVFFLAAFFLDEPVVLAFLVAALLVDFFVADFFLAGAGPKADSHPLAYFSVEPTRMIDTVKTSWKLDDLKRIQGRESLLVKSVLPAWSRT